MQIISYKVGCSFLPKFIAVESSAHILGKSVIFNQYLVTMLGRHQKLVYKSQALSFTREGTGSNQCINIRLNVRKYFKYPPKELWYTELFRGHFYRLFSVFHGFPFKRPESRCQNLQVPLKQLPLI